MSNPNFGLPARKAHLAENLPYLGQMGAATGANHVPGLISMIGFQENDSAVLGIIRTTPHPTWEPSRFLVRLTPSERGYLRCELRKANAVLSGELDAECDWNHDLVTWPLGAAGWRPISDIPIGVFEDIKTVGGDVRLYATDDKGDIAVIALNADHRDKLIKMLEV